MRNAIIALMRDLYFEESTARAVLIGIGYQPAQIPEFRSAVTFWPEVVIRLEHGILEDGLCRLLTAARTDHPGSVDAAVLHRSAGCAVLPVEREAPVVGDPMVLCLFADPLRDSKIRIDREARLIAQIADTGGIRVSVRHAVRVTDIVDLLLREQPRVLHFGGHGSRDGDLVFDNELDGEAKVGPASLAHAIAATASRPLDCVVLNSCFTGANAEAFRDATRTVVGSVTALDDEMALAFVRGFYTGIARGQAVRDAYETGRAEVELAGGDTSGLHFVVFSPAGRESSS